MNMCTWLKGTLVLCCPGGRGEVLFGLIGAVIRTGVYLVVEAKRYSEFRVRRSCMSSVSYSSKRKSPLSTGVIRATYCVNSNATFEKKDICTSRRELCRHKVGA
jgi:hypothetical protein